MLLPSHHIAAAARNRAMAPTLIGVGLGLLIVAAWWPDAPVATAVAIVTLGATDTMISRFRRTTAVVPILVLHGMAYLLLYALFVGARLHVPPAAPATGMSGLAMLDLAASTFPMAIALKRITNSLWQSALSRQ